MLITALPALYDQVEKRENNAQAAYVWTAQCWVNMLNTNYYASVRTTSFRPKLLYIFAFLDTHSYLFFHHGRCPDFITSATKLQRFKVQDAKLDQPNRPKYQSDQIGKRQRDPAQRADPSPHKANHELTTEFYTRGLKDSSYLD
jgi:hypothetical protein